MKGCLRSIIVFVALVSIVNLIMSFWEDVSSRTYDVPETDSGCIEQFVEDDFSGDRMHRRFWGFREQNGSYCAEYETFGAINQESSDLRSDLDVSYAEENFWGMIYGELVEQTGSKLDYLADSLLSISRKLEYSRLDLARLTVSFIQDIPYSYVIPSDCEEYAHEAKPCIGNVPYGIISPYEFVHSLFGDCDTRAVLLFILLERMQFDPMIVVSNEYAHAMLALNIPAQGDFLKHAGSKYYFWETTNTGWPIGMLPPDASNIDYWEIALVK